MDNNMERQLKLVEESYDKTIELGKKGVNLYDKWPSTYHGIDISRKTILLLQAYITKNRLTIGSLHCASIHNTPFEDNFFDIGACIGVLEYFEKDFVRFIFVLIR